MVSISEKRTDVSTEKEMEECNIITVNVPKFMVKKYSSGLQVWLINLITLVYNA